jgi:enoyl-CoA hydratase/carnithine racemase
VIGAQGANFLTWSCLHHLSEHYGPLFRPTPELEVRKDSGQSWYPLNHFRPLVNWTLDGEEEEEFTTWILGPLFQMAGLLLKEKRSHLSQVNAIGELCAQFRRGILVEMRARGPGEALRIVEAYHRLHPAAGKQCWHPEAFQEMESPSWRQLYVNAEHDGNAGVITIGRESYNGDVDAELNRAVDWLKSEGIDRVIVTGDFHLASQMIGADTSEFFPALAAEARGVEIAGKWSRTARRLHEEFQVSVGLVNGKRCLGGFLELLMHCHYLLAVEGADLGMPEVTLPVVPGMEGCHWPFRKTGSRHWPKLFKLLLEGRSVRAAEAVGWLLDYAGPMEEVLKTAWSLVTDGDRKLSRRTLEAKPLEGLPGGAVGLEEAGDAAVAAARQAIMETIRASCQAPLSEAVTIQARHSAGFMTGAFCKKGAIGTAHKKTMTV